MRGGRIVVWCGVREPVCCHPGPSWACHPEPNCAVSDFVHQRHKAPIALERPRELILALSPLRSNVNLARIVRTAGCCGVRRIIACGQTRIDAKIARDALQSVQIERHRSLLPVLRQLRDQEYRLVGLEQTSGSQPLYEYRFPRRGAGRGARARRAARRHVAAAGRCCRNPRLRAALQPQRSDGDGHCAVRILPAVSARLKSAGAAWEKRGHVRFCFLRSS